MRKIKRPLSVALAFITGVATFAMAACDMLGGEESSSGNTHTHAFKKWERLSDAENCEDGTFSRACSLCEYVEERKGTESDHVWSAEYGYNETHHWLVCEYCDEIKDEAKHVDNGVSVCNDCENWTPTTCVYYTLSEDGSYAIVTGYDDSKTDIVVIASTYEGVPVKEIAESAFAGCVGLTNVFLPDGITTIGDEAFYGCKNLMGILLCDSVTSIGQNVFIECNNLVIYSEAESAPASWGEDWNNMNRFVFWDYHGERMAPVSKKATKIMNSMLQETDESKRQTVNNPDLDGMRAPEGFMYLTRYDSKTAKDGMAWEKGNLEHKNYNNMDLMHYSDVWFATKLKNAYWVFVGGPNSIVTPWVYIHLKQAGKDELGYLYWTIEVSVGGYVYLKIENQKGDFISTERSENSIPRLLWDEGFSSVDGNAVLIYHLANGEVANIYTTEVLATRVGVEYAA